MQNSFVPGNSHADIPVKSIKTPTTPGFRKGQYHGRTPVFRV